MTTEEPRRFIPMPEQVPRVVSEGRSGYFLFQYVFRSGENYTLMDQETFEQLEVSPEQIGPGVQFMKEGWEGIVLTRMWGRILDVKLPPTVQLQVVALEETDALSEGTNLQWAILETNARILVPTSVKVGQIVEVHTNNGAFIATVDR